VDLSNVKLKRQKKSIDGKRDVRRRSVSRRDPRPSQRAATIPYKGSRGTDPNSRDVH